MCVIETGEAQIYDLTCDISLSRLNLPILVNNIEISAATEVE